MGFERVKQWAAFSKTWHLYDAKWQNPFQSAKVVTKYLMGKNKPVYHPFNDTGDHVVIINSKEVSLLGREWQYRVYFHHTGYPAAFKVIYILFLSRLRTISTSIKCSAHGQVERTTVDSCVAASRQRPNPYHVEGCLQQHEWQCVQAKQHDQTSCI